MARSDVNAIFALFVFSKIVTTISADNTTTSPMSFLYRTIVKCSEGDTFACLIDRSTHFIDSASNIDKFSLWDDTISLVKSKSDIDMRNTTANETSTQRSLGNSLDEFFDSHRIQLTLPRLSFFVPSVLSEGRGKKNRGYGLIAMTIAGALMAAGMAALAAMAGKALAASLAALAVATLSAMRKGGHGHGGGHSSYELISLPAHHRHRSFLDPQNTKPSPYSYSDPYSASVDSNIEDIK